MEIQALAGGAGLCFRGLAKGGYVKVKGGGVWLRFLNFFVVLWVGCCMSYKHELNNTSLVVMRGWNIERRCD